MKFIKDFLHNRDINKLKKKIARLQSDALQLQRNGKLRLYAEVMKEIDEVSTSLVEKLNENTTPASDAADYDGMGNQGRFPQVDKK